MADKEERRQLDELGRKIDALQTARRPVRKPPGKFAGAELGWRLTLELVAAIAIGAAMGWGLDSLFGSRPLFLIVMVLLGFAAGVRTMMRTVEIANRKGADGAGEHKGATGAADERD